MQLDEGVRERLAAEFRFAADKMAEAESTAELLFNFSAIFGETSRAIGIDYDPTLSLLHMVTQLTYQQVNSRINSLRTAPDGHMTYPDSYLGILTDVATELANIFEETPVQDERVFNQLLRLATVGYASTGHGYWMLTRGKIDLG